MQSFVLDEIQMIVILLVRASSPVACRRSCTTLETTRTDLNYFI